MKFQHLLYSLILIASTATVVSAQFDEPITTSKTSGITLGVYLNGSSVKAEDQNESESGGGLSVRLGYGFSENLQLYAAGTGANIEYADADDTYGMGHFDLGARYMFGSGLNSARPYLNAAFSGRAASFDFGTETADLRGTGFTVGGGLEYFVNPSLAFEGGLDLTFGEFSEGRVGSGSWQDLGAESFRATSGRFNLGLAWHP
jgi:opacity protein-like surface antigen